MRKEWKIYLRELLLYLRWMPLGLLFAAIPFLLGLPQWLRAGKLGVGAGISLIYGVVVPISIWLSFAAVYGVRVWLSLKTERRIRLSFIVHLLVNLMGLLVGI